MLFLRPGPAKTAVVLLVGIGLAVPATWIQLQLLIPELLRPSGGVEAAIFIWQYLRDLHAGPAFLAIPGLVFLGKQAIDTDNNQTGQMLAGLLNWSIGSFVSKLSVEGSTVKVTREVDGGLENIDLVAPAVITVDLRLNEPRYASLPNIMKAKKKPLDTHTPEELGIDVSPRLEVLRVLEPAGRAAGVRVNSADELVEKLRNEAKVI